MSATSQTVERTARSDRLVETIVSAVAEALDADPLSLDTRLGDVLDPDALTSLFDDRGDGTSRDGGRVTFRMLDCEVVVNADGRVLVTPPSEADAGTNSSTAMPK